MIAQIGTGVVVGPHARRIDGRGRFLIPGLIDSHVHVGNQGPLDDAMLGSHPELLPAYRAQLPRAYLAFGFTTLVDLDLKAETRAWFEAAPLHPNFYHGGRAVRIAGGYGAQQVPKDAAAAAIANLVYEPAQAGQWPNTLDARDYEQIDLPSRGEWNSMRAVSTLVAARRGEPADITAGPFEIRDSRISNGPANCAPRRRR